MGRSEAFCRGEQFYCYSIGLADRDDERDMMGFEAVNPAGSGLVAYLQRLAFPEEDASLMRTYLVRDNDTG